MKLCNKKQDDDFHKVPPEKLLTFYWK